MKKKPANYLLIICEDVRSEVDDKFSLIGVTAHPLKLKKTQGKSYATHSIAVYGELPNVKAPEQLEILVESPSGKTVAEGIAPVPEKSADTVVVAGKFLGVRFEESGKHSLTLSLDGQKYSKEFDIEIIE
ncbi:hypothetical protein ACEPT8_02150 [Pseudomonas aeruginosa]|nr:hypothetical protein [Pseudomonas aeruginosa]EIU2707772.1 hypothetical protein [Pseudomonas aeruginosa]EIU5250875.1 hypothetical protein [Pseudomonas aeruginosa]EKJ9723492.1 hypothetical protein [Pseudomonas aeruginosa]EKU4549397.1 hypothetical protein [Pseudomonas aeruginosa]EKW8363017.1 hypothetical protein [Pseudomonas aeruginosa]